VRGRRCTERGRESRGLSSGSAEAGRDDNRRWCECCRASGAAARSSKGGASERPPTKPPPNSGCGRHRPGVVSTPTRRLKGRHAGLRPRGLPGTNFAPGAKNGGRPGWGRTRLSAGGPWPARSIHTPGNPRPLGERPRRTRGDRRHPRSSGRARRAAPEVALTIGTISSGLPTAELALESGRTSKKRRALSRWRSILSRLLGGIAVGSRGAEAGSPGAEAARGSRQVSGKRRIASRRR